MLLNIAKVEVELNSDVDMYLFFEKGWRGGVYFICKRYSEVSNKYLKSYDSKQEPKHLLWWK